MIASAVASGSDLLPPENVSVVGSVVVPPLTQYGAVCARAPVDALTAISPASPHTDRSLLIVLVPTVPPLAAVDAPLPGAHYGNVLFCTSTQGSHHRGLIAARELGMSVALRAPRSDLAPRALTPEREATHALQTREDLSDSLVAIVTFGSRS